MGGSRLDKRVLEKYIVLFELAIFLVIGKMQRRTRGEKKKPGEKRWAPS